MTIAGKIGRDGKSGRTVVVHGIGALKGRLALDKDIDLTKPIAEQVLQDLRSL